MRNKGENNIKSGKTKRNKKIKKVISIIEYIVIFLVIFVNGILIFKSAQNPNKTPALFGKKAFVIISGSMIPKINIGDVVILNDTNDVHVGDIIGFRRNSTAVVHRIIKEMLVDEKVMYQTKGDNNDIPDIDLVDNSTIEGVLIAKIPFIGKILIWLYNNLAIVIVVIIVILILKYYFFS